jgi:DNA-binding MarR family transcriptional regulator
VDLIAEQWARERPDLDSSPLHVIGRVSRLTGTIDEAYAVHMDNEARLLAGLSPDERADLVRLLRRLAESFAAGSPRSAALDPRG